MTILPKKLNVSKGKALAVAERPVLLETQSYFLEALNANL
jgi:hypothetical protein